MALAAVVPENARSLTIIKYRINQEDVIFLVDTLVFHAIRMTIISQLRNIYGRNIFTLESNRLNIPQLTEDCHTNGMKHKCIK